MKIVELRKETIERGSEEAESGINATFSQSNFLRQVSIKVFHVSFRLFFGVSLSVAPPKRFTDGYLHNSLFSVHTSYLSF